MKFKIDNDILIDEFFHDARILGIVAPIPDYKFCWHVNNLLKFSFRINTSLEIQLVKKERNYFFSIYDCCEKGGTIKHYLYNNTHEGEYLLPEYKHLDFLWLIKDDIMNNIEVDALVGALKSIAGVQLVVEMDIEKIKNRQHLIF
ncbi:MAG: hypothetical protein NVSMB45_00360 [Ginsengibacter sp.]